MNARSVLVVGGTRSGKSALAQRWAEARAPLRLYLATGLAEDEEMRARVECHRAARGTGWACLEEPLDPVGALRGLYAGTAAGSRGMPGVVLLDCVSLWIANLMAAGAGQEAILDHVAGLARYVAEPPRPVALVSAETGLGLVPQTSVGRMFRDVLGLANQVLAQACDTALFVSCGLPLVLKGELPPEAGAGGGQ